VNNYAHNNMLNHELLEELATLLKTRSIKLGDFVLSSGRRSSYYIDARRTTMSAAGLDLIGQLGLQLIRKLAWEADSIGGLTLGADPVAYAIAVASRSAPPPIDAFTVRKEAKVHGTGQLIEGCFEKGARVVVVEDVFTTGGSALRALEAVRAAGGVAAGVLGVVDRDEGGLAAIRKMGIPAEAMLSIRDLGVKLK
jgi:orotate phosphoribosyltransferase